MAALHLPGPFTLPSCRQPCHPFSLWILGPPAIPAVSAEGLPPSSPGAVQCPCACFHKSLVYPASLGSARPSATEALCWLLSSYSPESRAFLLPQGAARTLSPLLITSFPISSGTVPSALKHAASCPLPNTDSNDNSRETAFCTPLLLSYDPVYLCI